jgi:hypothetical protein
MPRAREPTDAEYQKRLRAELERCQAEGKALRKRIAELEAEILTGKYGWIGEEHVVIPNAARTKIIDVVKLTRSGKEN